MMRDLFSFAEPQDHAKNRRARSRAPKLAKIDTLAMWRSLPCEEANYLGALAAAFFISAAGMDAHVDIPVTFETFEQVMRETYGLFGDLLHFHFPRAFVSANGQLFPKLPDLAVLRGIHG